jgi:hypothetical protein
MRLTTETLNTQKGISTSVRITFDDFFSQCLLCLQWLYLKIPGVRL